MSENTVPTQSAPTQDPNDMGICCTLLIRLWGIVAAILIILCGVVRVFSISPLCIGAGVYLMVFGIVTFLLEAPIILSFIPTAAPIYLFLNRYLRPWVRCIIYFLLIITPLALCRTVTVFLAAMLWFVTFALNAVLVIGAKGKGRDTTVPQREDFSLRSVAGGKGKSEDTSTLIGNLEGDEV